MKATYLIACGLLLLAVVLDWSAKNQCSLAARCAAERLHAIEAERFRLKHESESAAALADWLILSGVIAAAVGVAFWGVSFFQQRKTAKRLTPVIPLILLITYVLFVCISV